ncbi:chromate efflux transporter [Aurantimonas sp. VKM B-3413]|uniref:chromate efflux transporter n=1 Tax=Aurantimonas sp. VKM B-3413 TaxID=2779401 RepID=UPI001E53FA95|nr:chromate efflux transporter [Aurantimonas sp. VKM B-3413]MCB8838168.1 chromate efflux transporter [Aurantimonas sp. VKM B-3413]
MTGARPAGSAREVLLAFAKLGVSAFGGPIAHLGYFRDEFVTRRQWLSEARFADLVALCQFLPGPASSQVGFALGLMRAGPLGALAAFTAFTLPSAALLLLFAANAAHFSSGAGLAIVHGLKLVAVAVVAQAVLGMAKSLTPDAPRATIALAAVGAIAALPGSLGQIAAIGLGTLAGLLFLRRDIQPEPERADPVPVSRRAGLAALATLAVLILALPLLVAATASSGFDLFAGIFRSGALVFGGGHVVLPLLQAETVDPGYVTSAAFLAGYGAAQAVPGPLFTFAAYLGAIADAGPGGVPGAFLATAAIFLPGLLILVAALPFWEALRRRPRLQAALRGINAAVVGILAAALYDPVFVTAVADRVDFALALSGFVLLVAWKTPPIVVVCLGALAGIVLQAI